jgi:pilus assembly protein FimV
MTLGRRILLLVASGSLLYSGVVSALGMGEITLHSALNQSLNAEIVLLDVGELSAEDIRVVLASSSDYERAGVERLAFLQNLTFTPVIEGDRSRIRVASSSPVREPYLNFLVEITRAKSRLLREYTVLLDPMPSTPQLETRAIISAPRAEVSPVHTEPSRIAPPVTLPQASLGKRHVVAGGENLWMVANAYMSEGGQGSLSQFMHDIQTLNPNAFADGDPGRLNAGANLLLPDAAAQPAIAQAEQAVESASIDALIPMPRATELTAAEEQVAVLRRQLFEELAASRDENRQLKEMLGELQLELERVSAQLQNQGSLPEAATEQPSTIEPLEPVVTTPSIVEPQSTTGRPDSASSIAQPAVMSAARNAEWRDWTILGAGVLASLLLGGLWFSRRNKSAAKALEAAPNSSVLSKRLPPSTLTAGSDMPRQPAHASVSETDVLEAADIYLTYGRRAEALDVLQRGVERAPDQLDLRLRLLGLLAESGDVEAYNGAATAYLQAGGDSAQLNQLVALHPVLAAAVAPIASSQGPAETVAAEAEFILTLNEPMAAAPVSAEDRSVTDDRSDDSVESSTASQPWLDDFDEVLTLGELPALLDNTDSFASMPLAEEIRQLEPNPEHLVRLNQAVAYIKQGDIESACTILESLATEGDEQQRQQVNELLAQIA